MKKIKWSIVGIACLLLLSTCAILETVRQNNQAISASILGASFRGEYRIEDGPWIPIVEGEHIPASQGDVVLRGNMYMVFPDGSIVSPLAENDMVAMYFDHIGGSVWIDGTEVHRFDAENPIYGSSTCGKMWLVYVHQGTENEVVEIHLENPHRFGNELAIDSFLETMTMYPGMDFNLQLLNESEQFRSLGVLILFGTVLILGIAIFSNILRLKQCRALYLAGMISGFAGIYFVTSAVAGQIWKINIGLHTTLSVLSVVLYVFFSQALIQTWLIQPLKAKGLGLVSISGIGTAFLIGMVVLTEKKIYDILPIWTIFQTLLCISLLLICCKNLRYLERRMAVVQTMLLITLGGILLDILAIWQGWWSSALCSQGIFMILFVMTLFSGLYVLPKGIQLHIEEKERQAELEKSKTAVMLSQIQPHFLYNSLGAIRELCRQEPDEAQMALDHFITYLRGNMASIQRDYTIPFSKELAHISAYLQLEKMRFGDDLNIVYDIQEKDFFLPSLTVQPLVENAVKHGVCGREEGGTVTLHTHREGSKVVIQIHDDGIGFDPTKKEGRTGLTYVSKRLKYSVDGTLEIDSEIGVGTTVTITINEEKD